MYVIRADGNAKIGAGHLMRCLTIADALAHETGREEILFLCADERSAELAKRHGFAARALGTDYRDLEMELPAWEEFHKKSCVILIDSYYVTKDYLKALGRIGRTILLDDMGEDVFPVDAVVNYNAFAEEETYQELYQNKNTMCYAGARYVPLRPQFTGVSYEVRDRVREVLITVGGGDAADIAGRIWERLTGDRNLQTDTTDSRKLNYHLIIGQFHPHVDAWRQRAASCANLFLHQDVEDMAGLMKRCDLAVTAGGTTVYELAAVGVPLICFSCAENQERLARYVGEHAIAGYAGAFHRDAEGTLERMCGLAEEFCRDKSKRNMCYEKERAMTDGKGAGRIAEKMIALSRRA